MTIGMFQIIMVKYIPHFRAPLSSKQHTKWSMLARFGSTKLHEWMFSIDDDITKIHILQKLRSVLYPNRCSPWSGGDFLNFPDSFLHASGAASAPSRSPRRRTVPRSQTPMFNIRQGPHRLLQVRVQLSQWRHDSFDDVMKAGNVSHANDVW